MKILRYFLLHKSSKYASQWLVLGVDLFLISFNLILAYLVRFQFDLSFINSSFYLSIVFTIITATISFLSVGSFKGVIRHTGFKDAVNVLMGLSVLVVLNLSLVLGIRAFKIFPLYTIPISVILIHYLLNIIGLIFSRFGYKTLFHYLKGIETSKTNILIYGAGESGLTTYMMLQKNIESAVNVVGFIDDNIGIIGKRINRSRVYLPTEIDGNFIKVHKISEVIVSIQIIEKDRLNAIAENLLSLGLKVKIVPPIKQWVDGDLKINQIKNIRIEDLLGREPIKLNNLIVQEELKGRNVLITGAAGSIGSELARQVAKYNYKNIILLDIAESPLYDIQQELIRKGKSKFHVEVADIRDSLRIHQIFEEYKPDLVFHAAAYKHVPLMEDVPYEAVATNIFGTYTLSNMAINHKVKKFVMVSTDKAVNPTNVMGATKRLSEMYVSSLKNNNSTKFITTRFGNVLGSNGSVIPLFRKQIEEGGPLTVTHKEITRYFMTIEEACELVLEAGAMGNGGEIYVFDMGEPIKIFNLAKKMIQLSGLRYPEDVDIQISGLRPGEKIYEELLGTGENTKPTHNKKIMIANVIEPDREFILTRIKDLFATNLPENGPLTVSKIKTLVPEFISNNSIFESLDNIMADGVIKHPSLENSSQKQINRPKHHFN
jgi:FlaA1/EpsC-like NDP-sugar epimerase